jgi:type IV pilus assembly protein PilB
VTTTEMSLPPQAERLIAALANERIADSIEVRQLVHEGMQRGLSAVRAALESGLALDVLERAAWWHQGYDTADIIVDRLDMRLFQKLPLSMARAYEAMPIGQDSLGVHVAVADPDNLAVVDDIRRRFAPEVVRILVGDRGVIESALSSLEHRLASNEFAIDEVDDGFTAVNLEDQAGDGRVSQIVTKTIELAVASRASDIHIEPADDHVRIRIRVDGVLTEVARYPISAGQGIINNLKVRAGLDVAERRQPQDGRITANAAGRVLDLRLVTLPTVWRAEGAVLRILDRTRNVATLDQLGYSTRVRQTWERLAQSPYGALLATGPTGSGKTTSLYATLAKIATIDVKVCTVEDPVEYRLPGVMQMQVDLKAGRTFASALKAYLRSDPDIILVGEIRDTITANTAIEAALTGHLLLASLHANTAVMAPTRLIEMGIEPYLVSSAVRGVLSQRLARRLCMHCRVSIPSPSNAFRTIDAEVPDHIFRAADKGCARCSGTGYFGRIAIAEVFEITEAVSTALSLGANAGDLVRLAEKEGMVPMYQEGLTRVLDGVTSLEELARVIN